MIPYLAVAALPLALKFFFPKLDENEKHKKTFLFIYGVILFLFMGFRGRLLGSTDTLNYYITMQDAIGCESWDEFYDMHEVEKGFQIFVFCLSRIFTDPQALLVVTSLFFVFGITVFVHKNSEDIALSMSMYVCLGLMQFHMQGMRQSIAMTICLFAYEFAKRKKLIPFLLLVFLASSFHRTAIVFLVVYLLCFLKVRGVSVALFTAISFVLYLFSDRIVSKANEFFEVEYTTTAESGGFVALAIYIIIVAFVLLFEKRIKIDQKYATLFWILILGTVFFIMRYTGALAAERISFYFMFSQIILLPNSISSMKQEERILLKSIVYLLIFALFAYRLNGSEFIPYKLSFTW